MESRPWEDLPNLSAGGYVSVSWCIASLTRFSFCTGIPHLKLQYFPNRTRGPLLIGGQLWLNVCLCSTEYSYAQLFSSSAILSSCQLSLSYVDRITSLQQILYTTLNFFSWKGILMYLDEFHATFINTIIWYSNILTI